MSEDRLEQASAEVITKTANGMETATEFFVSEIPDVAQQTLSFYLALGIVEIAFGFLMLGACTPWYYIYKKAREKCITEKRDNLLWEYSSRDKSADIQVTIAAVVSLVIFFAIGGVIFVSRGLFDVLKITLAPKLWLIEYAGSLT